MPWRSEIEEGIAKCSKFVALVDAGWLCSYNCLQELALAFAHRKPVLCIVLNQEAWELLTVPGGAEIAMAEADRQMQKCESSSSAARPNSIVLNMDCTTGSKDESSAAPAVHCDGGPKALFDRSSSDSVQSAAHACWSSREHGVPLLSYRGQEIIPGMPLSKDVSCSRPIHAPVLNQPLPGPGTGRDHKGHEWDA